MRIEKLQERLMQVAYSTGLDQCSLATGSAVCFESNGGNGANDPGSSTVTYTGTDYTYMAVTITGNSELNKSGPTATGTATTSSSGVIKSGPTATGSSSPTTTSGNVASQTSSTITSSSHAGVAAVTGNAAFAMGGLAVAMAVLG